MGSFLGARPTSRFITHDDPDKIIYYDSLTGVSRIKDYDFQSGKFAPNRKSLVIAIDRCAEKNNPETQLQYAVWFGERSRFNDVCRVPKVSE